MGKCALPGVNFEHAWGDGAAVLSYMNKINHYIEETLADKSCILTPNFTTDKVSTVDEIKFTLTEEINSRIQQAEKEHDERWNRLQCCVMPLGKAPAVMNEFYYDQSNSKIRNFKILNNFRRERNTRYFQTSSKSKLDVEQETWG